MEKVTLLMSAESGDGAIDFPAAKAPPHPAQRLGKNSFLNFQGKKSIDCSLNSKHYMHYGKCKTCAVSLNKVRRH